MNSILFHGENRIPIVIEIQILQEPNINPNVCSSMNHTFQIRAVYIRKRRTPSEINNCFFKNMFCLSNSISFQG